MNDVRYFTIPANDLTEWDDETHGVEADPDSCDTGEFQLVSWHRQVGGTEVYQFDTSVSEESHALKIQHRRLFPENPDLDVLRGIHEYLKFARPSGTI